VRRLPPHERLINHERLRQLLQSVTRLNVEHKGSGLYLCRVLVEDADKATSGGAERDSVPGVLNTHGVSLHDTQSRQ